MVSQVIIADTIRGIPKEQWDALTGENPLSSYGWLLTVEETLLNEVRPRYFVFRDDENIVGGAVCYIASKKAKMVTLDNHLFGRLKPAANAAGISFLPGMVCCPFKSSGHHILVAEDMDGLQKEKVIRQILEAMEVESDKKKISLAFTQVCEHEGMLITLLTQRGFHRTTDLPLTYLSVLWDTFEGYKKYIREKSLKWKRNIAQDINKHQKSGVIIEPAADDLIEWEKPMIGLLNRHYLTHNNIALPYNENILNRLKTNLKENVVIYRARIGGSLIGLSVMVKKDGVWSFVLVGIDQALAKKNATYFNILFYRPIEDAIASKIRKIYYGNGLYEVKIRRGCDIAKTFIFYKNYRRMFHIPVKIWFLLHHLWYQRKFG
jgi:predicted N-acyltransferase